MSEFFPAYCELISSPIQLAECQQAGSLPELLRIIKTLWSRCDLADEYLLNELNQLNQTVIDTTTIYLAPNWLPYGYQSKSRSIYWCLPTGHAAEPFQDEYISRCRQTLLVNQIIQPRTSLDSLYSQSQTLVKIQPAGFIFHLSRCGSTLVSGCLSELDSTCIFSESPVFTEILLDSSLTLEQQQTYLHCAINLQAAVFSDRPEVIIKWNAWDIFRWNLICAIYPDVPVIFLIRNPVEILASHQRSAGRHMSGDSSMAYYHPVFSVVKKESSLQEFRICVLQGLLSAMLEHYFALRIKIVDYRSVDADGISGIAHHFNLKIKPIELIKIQERMRFHSKTPGKLFNSDHQQLIGWENKDINTGLLSTYHQLLELTDSFKETSHVE